MYGSCNTCSCAVVGCNRCTYAQRQSSWCQRETMACSSSGSWTLSARWRLRGKRRTAARCVTRPSSGTGDSSGTRGVSWSIGRCALKAHWRVLFECGLFHNVAAVLVTHLCFFYYWLFIYGPSVLVSIFKFTSTLLSIFTIFDEHCYGLSGAITLSPNHIDWRE